MELKSAFADADSAAEVGTAKPDEKKAWVAYPEDEESYEIFVRYVLEQASQPNLDEMTSAPMSSGMAEGLDIRATIRHWLSGGIYVREPAGASVRITNGLIDWPAPARTRGSYRT